MARPPRHLSDLDLITAVRAQLAADPDVSQAEVRARIGGTQAVVSAAMRAVLIELGRMKLTDGVELDPRFASLVHLPEPPTPLDLHSAVPTELAKTVTDHLAQLSELLHAVVQSIQDAALAAMSRERADATSNIEAADRRAARAEQYVETLPRELAESVGDADRLHAAVAEREGQHTLEIARLTRELSDARTAHAHAETGRQLALVERDAANIALSGARDAAFASARDLAASEAREKGLERHLADLAARLTVAEVSLATARAAEADARATAAGALAKYEARDGMVPVKREGSRRRGMKPRSHGA